MLYFLLFATVLVLAILLSLKSDNAVAQKNSMDYLKSATKRMSFFIQKLYTEGRITKEEYNLAVFNKTKLENNNEADNRPVEEVKEEVSDIEKEEPESVPENSYEYASEKDEDKEVESKKGISLDSVLILGVMLIVFAGVIFATTAWHTLSDIAKVGIVFAGSLIFFGITEFTERKLNLIKTGKAFFVLGSIFGVIGLISVGFFKIFGDWFSLTGEGKYLLFAGSSALLGIFSHAGMIKYKMKEFAWVGYSALSATVFFMILLLKLPDNISALILSIYTVIFTLLAESFSQEESEDISLVSLKSFAKINAYILGIIAVVMSTNGIFAFLTSSIVALLFLKKLFNEDESNFGAYAFTIFGLIAIIKFNMPSGIGDFGIIMVIMSVITAVLGFGGLIDESVKKVMNGISLIIAFIALGALSISAVTVTEWTYVEQITVAVLLANVTYYMIKNGDKLVSALQNLLVIFFLNGVARLISTDISEIAVITAILTAIVFASYFALKNKKIKTEITDLIFTGTVFGCSILTMAESNFDVVAAFICSIILSFMIVIKIIQKNNYFTDFYCFALPVGIGIIFKNISTVSGSSESAIFGYFILVSIAATTAFLLKKKSMAFGVLAGRIHLPFEIATWIVGILAIFTVDNNLIYIWSLTVFALVKSWFSRKNERISYFYIGTALIYIATFKTAGLFLGEGISPNTVFAKLSAVSVISIIYFAIPFIMKYIGKNQTIEREFKIAADTGLIFMSAVLCINLGLIQNPELWQIFVAGIIPVISYIGMSINKKNSLGIIPVLSFYGVIFNSFDSKELLWIGILIFAVFGTIGRYYYKKIFENEEGKCIIDWLTVSCVIPALWMIFIGKGYWNFAGYIFLSGWFLLYYGKLAGDNRNRKILTLSSAAFCFGLLGQTFVKIPEIIKSEYIIFVIFVFLGTEKLIWQKSEEAGTVDTIVFSAAIISSVYLIIDALKTQEIIDTLIIGIASIMMLIGAFLIKKKRWFVLATVLIVGLTIYMSREFWLSIAWWVYLMCAGVILIIFAARNELKKRNEDVESKKENFMDDWKW